MLRYDVYTLSSETMEEARLELHRTMQYQDNINTPLLVSNYIKITSTPPFGQLLYQNNNNMQYQPIYHQ